MIITLFCIPALAFIREEPPSPPSVVANDTNNSMGLKEGCKELISNRNYLLLFAAFMLVYGIQASMGAIYANLASVYHYSLSSIGISCVLFLFGGVLNSFLLGTLLDKYQCYRRLVSIVSLMSLLTTLFHFVSLPFQNPMVECFTMLLIGMSVVPISSVCFVFSVELAYPVPEALTNGMMITIGLLWGTGLGFGCTSLIEIDPRYALSLWSAMALMSLIISRFVEEDLRRLNQDEVKNSEYLEEDEVRR
jgi:sugar phosphate permease